MYGTLWASRSSSCGGPPGTPAPSHRTLLGRRFWRKEDGRIAVVVRARLLVRLQSSTVQYVLGASVLPWYIVSALDNSAVGCITLLCTTHHFCPNRSRLWRGCDHCQDLGSRFQVHGGSTQSCTYTVPVFGSDPCIVHCSSYCTAYCTEYCTLHCALHYTLHCTLHCTLH
jgi:hypothetical protein